MFDVGALNSRVAASRGDQRRSQTNEIKNVLFPFDEIPNDSRLVRRSKNKN